MEKDSIIEAVPNKGQPGDTTRTTSKQTGGITHNVHHVLNELKIPKDWRLFLSRNENKSNLVECYSSHSSPVQVHICTKISTCTSVEGLGEKHML